MLDHVDALVVKVVFLRVKIGKGFLDLCQDDLFGLGAQVVKITTLASLHFHLFSRPLGVLWVGRVRRSSPNSHTTHESHQDRNVTAMIHFGSHVRATNVRFSMEI